LTVPRAVFTPWKCGDCDAHGQIRHAIQASPEFVAERTAEQHARKSPECHQRAQSAQAAAARLSPRDRHILTTARIKRKLMADALRIQRTQERTAAIAAMCERWGVAADTLSDVEKLVAYKSAGSPTRANWIAGKATRKGYAFT
jgi:hypothetical protein